MSHFSPTVPSKLSRTLVIAIVIPLLIGTLFLFTNKGKWLLVSSLSDERVPHLEASALESGNWEIIDARTSSEFKVSALPNATLLSIEALEKIDAADKFSKSDSIAVYCSVGIRSQALTERLLSLGYKNAFNLKGGIFKWKNSGRALVNASKAPTDSVHGYNWYWATLLKNGPVLLN